jgi:extradiol dioxygenase family protein
MNAIRPFHVAFPVNNLEATRKFYADVLGCKVGRSAERWIDFDLYSHQISAHLVDEHRKAVATNQVDGKSVPVLHWGVILSMEEWETLAGRLKAHGIKFIIEPYIRFKGEVGEQGTMFFLDPSGNALEFKAFKDDASIFATK